MEYIYPMFVMVVLTTIVGILTAYNRIKGAYAGEVDPRYFKLLTGFKVSDRIAKYGRNFDNLFEVPVLFYAAGICALALKLDSQIILALMWAFTVFRIIHSIIHISYNNPMHRFVPFVLSLLCVFAMWLTIVILIS